MDGILIIDKPDGFTSHDVVARIRRVLQTKRVGHTGTLDPFATGVMIVLVGKATRLAQFLDKDEKEYEAIVRFGFETDTGDRTGVLTRSSKPENVPPGIKSQISNLITIEEINNALENFRGETEQIPPMYSAKKIDGKKLYELARKGIEVERKPVRINVSKIEAFEVPENIAENNTNIEIRNVDLGLRVSCSAGTYIRTLAEDIGRKIGIGAHLAELRRIRAGKFLISEGVTLDELQKADDPRSYLLPMEAAVSHLSPFVLNADRTAKTLNGLSTRINNAGFENGQVIQMLNENQKIIAIGFYNEAKNAVQPKIVLN